MIDIVKHVKASGGLTVRVQCRGHGAKTTEVEVCMALVCASTDDGRLLIGGTNFVLTVGRFR